MQSFADIRQTDAAAAMSRRGAVSHAAVFHNNNHLIHSETRRDRDFAAFDFRIVLAGQLGEGKESLDTFDFDDQATLVDVEDLGADDVAVVLAFLDALPKCPVEIV